MQQIQFLAPRSAVQDVAIRRDAYLALRKGKVVSAQAKGADGDVKTVVSKDNPQGGGHLSANVDADRLHSVCANLLKTNLVLN
jgi:hypothetical protein